MRLQTLTSGTSCFALLLRLVVSRRRGSLRLRSAFVLPRVMSSVLPLPSRGLLISCFQMIVSLQTVALVVVRVASDSAL